MQGVPQRKLLSTSDLRSRAEHFVSKHNPSKDGIHHPAIQTMLDRISKNTTPFDDGQYESQAWTQKYAPANSGEVLHAGKEMRVLRDWLASQKVTSTRFSNTESTLANKSLDKHKRRKKRRKLNDDELNDLLLTTRTMSAHSKT